MGRSDIVGRTYLAGYDRPKQYDEEIEIGKGYIANRRDGNIFE